MSSAQHLKHPQAALIPRFQPMPELSRSRQAGPEAHALFQRLMILLRRHRDR